jgi:hypothetical protein
MAETPVDYSQVYDFLYRIDRRISYLEKDASFIEQQLTALEYRKSRDFYSMTDELKNLRSDMTAIKTNFAQCAHGMSRLGKMLKDTIKKEDIQSLNVRVDEIKFEEYVTPGDIKRGV